MQTASIIEHPAARAAITGLLARSPRAAMAPRNCGRRYESGEEIFCEGDPAGAFYRVESGVVRTSKLLNDGRRQIDAFHLAGDIFGMERGWAHRFSAEAVGEATVVAIQRASLEDMAASEGALAQEVLASTMRLLERAQDHLVLLGRKTAMEKIATFLLDMAERSAAGDTVELPMSRSDIADHLGLTIETVCRTLTELQRREAIKLPARRRVIVLRNKALLRRMTM
jgi:CRP/FNR family transcriptional regulator, nitrogen fixation regulation protein